ncbi:MAG TPA: Hpt domain-containing protein [Nitrospira sp.]|nr:Hpt domain-containing protein [Nitrospira sp.]
MAADPVFDLEETLTRLDGDRELFGELAALFLKEYRKDVETLRAALHRAERGSAASVAHRLKGSVMQFCAFMAVDIVRRTEELCRQGDLTSASALRPALETRLDELEKALREALEAGRNC